MKSNKGITLVALVITIIILLILAGVSIASLSNSGLFGQTRNAVNETKNAQNLENSTLDDYGTWINNYMSNNH